jgi:hypothetical protein
VNNLRGTLGRFAPELLETEFACEMWAQFEQGTLTADSKLGGVLRATRGPLMPMASWWRLRMPGRKRCDESWGGKARARAGVEPEGALAHRRRIAPAPTGGRG